MNTKAIEQWLRSEVETTGARLRSWRERECDEDTATRGLDDFVDAAQQTMLVETRSAHAARLGDRIRRLARAIERLRDGCYGVCTECDEPIVPARLRALPDAELCMTCQRAWERSAGESCLGDHVRPVPGRRRARRRRHSIRHRQDPSPGLELARTPSRPR